MRTLLQTLHEIVEPRLIQRGCLDLCEDDPGSTCPPTRIDRPGQSLALRLGPWRYSDTVTIPANRWLFPLFRTDSDHPPLCRSCDYVVFSSPRAEELFVLLCELKSGRARQTRAQLLNGKILAEHILSAARLHGAVPSWPRVEFRGLVFAGDAPLQKGATRTPGGVDYLNESPLKTAILRAGLSYPLSSFCC